MDVLVQLPIGKKESAPARGGPLAPVKSSCVTAEPEVVVPLDAQLEQFIESGFASSRAGADAGLRFIVVAFSARKPMRAKRSPHRGERPEAVRIFPAGPCFGR